MLTVPLAWRARLVALAVCGGWAGGLFCQRLYQLQVVEGAVWRHRSQLGTTEVQSIPAPRGRLVDARGRILVTNEPRYGVTVTPGVLSSDGIRQLTDILGIPSGPLRVTLSQHRRVAPLEPVWVGHALNPSQVARVAEMQAHRRGVQLQIHPQRSYPYGQLASHVVGYVGDISAGAWLRLRRAGYRPTDTVGESGLEAHYESFLRGRAGSQRATVDPLGHVTGLQSLAPPKPGPDLQLSLDVALQAHAEEALQRTLDDLAAHNGEKTAGAVVVLEATSGRVLALVSRPNFDPRQFSAGISNSDYHRLMIDELHPLLSRAYQASYPPGSTFKIINASASLQTGLCTPQSMFYCSGLYKGFHCFARAGHGAISFTETIAQSCDATYYQLGDKLGIDRLARFAAAFGLGRRTGIDLADEQDGLLATPSWKQRVFKQSWSVDDTINMSIGQGMLNATPLQMAVATAAVVNGGYIYCPHLVDRVVSWDHKVLWRYHPHPVRRVPVQAQWLAAVKVGMLGVVDHGTARAAHSSLISIGGKTGTAEAMPTADNPKGRNHTWFVSFAPADRPQVVAVVLVVKAGGFGGGVAAPIARDVLEYWASHGAARAPVPCQSGARHVPGTPVSSQPQRSGRL